MSVELLNRVRKEIEWRSKRPEVADVPPWTLPLVEYCEELVGLLRETYPYLLPPVGPDGRQSYVGIATQNLSRRVLAAISGGSHQQ